MPVFAALADRLGRRPVLAVGPIALVVASYPGFALMGRGNVTLLVIRLVVLGLLTAITFTASLPILPELFATTTVQRLPHVDPRERRLCPR